MNEWAANLERLKERFAAATTPAEKEAVLQQLRQLKEQALQNANQAVKTPADFPIIRPIDPNQIEILSNAAFQNSCRQLGDRSLLDTPRLANLWQLAQLTDPQGAMMEIGTYRGGGALHLSNACPGRHLLVCDPFDSESFEKLDPRLDHLFHAGQFSSTSRDMVAALLQGKNCQLIPGYFPDSVAGVALPKISFVHLDVDVYHAVKESLLFLLLENVLLPKSLIVLDDYLRHTAGVKQAVDEVSVQVPELKVFPMFPGQGLIVPPTW